MESYADPVLTHFRLKKLNPDGFVKLIPPKLGINFKPNYFKAVSAARFGVNMQVTFDLSPRGFTFTETLEKVDLTVSFHYDDNNPSILQTICCKTLPLYRQETYC